MSMISEIILVRGIKLDKNYINVLDYSEDEMVELCREKAIDSAGDYSFIRNKGTIATNFSYRKCLQANYIAFQNKDYSNKWFFAFIDNVKYISNENTEISYTIDSFSTWWDYWTKHNCFINRQHVLDDTIGKYTLDEGLNYSEYVCEYSEMDSSFSDYKYIAVASNFNPSNEQQYQGITCYNKQVFGTKIYLFEGDTTGGLNALNLFLFHINKLGHISDVENIFYVPDALIEPQYLQQYTTSVETNSGNQEYSFWSLNYSFNVASFNTTIAKKHSFNGFTPKNNKCFVFPFNFLEVSNNVGQRNIYKYEDFTSNDCVFKNEGVISVGNSIRCVPLNFKGLAENVDESVQLAKYPTIAWSSDAYTNWLTQNAVNFQMEGFSSLINSLLGIANGLGAMSSEKGMSASGVVSSVTGFLGNVTSSEISLIKQFNNADFLSNNSKGTNNGDINFQSGWNSFLFKQIRLKTEYLQIVDSFFTRYGYKIGKIDVPHLSGRKSWNYVEIGSSSTIGNGTVPSIYMEDINNSFRKGVTIWHNHDELGNFALDNSII